MKLRWRPAKGAYYLSSMSTAEGGTTVSVFNSEEESTTPVFRTENNMHLVLQYCEPNEESWKDVELGEEFRLQGEMLKDAARFRKAKEELSHE